MDGSDISNVGVIHKNVNHDISNSKQYTTENDDD